jgi:erythronate-4-phosphate dehydrogenase
LNKKYNLVADEDMPLINELFGDLANITKLSGREISAADVKNADALLVRSITNVDQKLLKGSKVQFVGTATIGIDHIDTDWLEENDIQWSSAAGCNAAAVAQYVISGICTARS